MRKKPFYHSGIYGKVENINYILPFLGNIRSKITTKFNPDIVIGTGGYVTAPVIWAAKKLGHKTFIHEQNSVVGLSNKYLTKYVDKIGVSFERIQNPGFADSFKQSFNQINI